MLLSSFTQVNQHSSRRDSGLCVRVLTETLSINVADADAIAAGRLDGYTIDAALTAFAREKSAWDETIDLADSFSLSMPKISARYLSGRIDPGAVNQGLAILKASSPAPPDLALLSHALSHQNLNPEDDDRQLSNVQIQQHHGKGRKVSARFGDIPAQGMVLASKHSDGNLTFSIALPKAETVLADKLINHIEALPRGVTTRHHMCGRLVLEGRAKGSAAEQTRLTEFVRAHAPMAARRTRAATLSLFLPYERLTDEGLPFRESPEWEMGVLHYFLPHLEPLFGLGENHTNRCAHLRTNQQTQAQTGGSGAGATIDIDHPSYPRVDEEAPRLSCRIDAFRAHSLGGKVMLLEVVLDLASGSGGTKEEINDNFTFAETLDFIALARRVRELYDSPAPDADGTERNVTWALNEAGATGAEQDLLAALTARAGLGDPGRYRYLGDDRAFVMQSILLDGTAPEPGTNAAQMLDIALERTAMVDGWGDGRFCAEHLAREEFSRSAYPRFANTGSMLAATEHSFSFVGFAGRWAGDTDTEPSFAEKLIHPEHMPQIYRRMVVYAQIVRRQLDLFEARLDALVADRAAHDAPNGNLPLFNGVHP